MRTSLSKRILSLHHKGQRRIFELPCGPPALVEALALASKAAATTAAMHDGDSKDPHSIPTASAHDSLISRMMSVLRKRGITQVRVSNQIYR